MDGLVPKLKPPIPNIPGIPAPHIPIPNIPGIPAPHIQIPGIPSLGGLTGELIWKPIIHLIDNLLMNNFIVKFFKDLAEFLAARPYLSMPLFGLGLTIITPVLVFVFFAIVTAFITFVGFLIAEGSLLLMGAVILGSYLLSTFGVAMVICTLFGILYFTLQKAKIVK